LKIEASNIMKKWKDWKRDNKKLFTKLARSNEKEMMHGNLQLDKMKEKGLLYLSNIVRNSNVKKAKYVSYVEKKKWITW